MEKNQKNQKNVNRIYKALNLLYLATKDQQKEYRKTFKEIKRLQFLKEFSTIKLCAARQTGHTTAICKFLLDRKKEKWLLLADSNELLDNARKMIISGHEKNNDSEMNRLFWSSVTFKKNHEGGCVKTGTVKEYANVAMEDRYRGLQLDGIIIDCASFISASKIERIYEALGPCLCYTNGVIIFVE